MAHAKPSPTTVALIAALDAHPGTLRALARAAGVAHSTLSRIRAGTLEPSPEVARAVADALRTWATDCTTAARAITSTLSRRTP